MEEEWRWIPGYEGVYRASSLGRVFSEPRFKSRGGFLKPHIDRGGYPQIVLVSNGKRRTLTVHGVVALAFHGPRPTGKEVRHLDGDKLNSSPQNLAYGTRPENARDKRIHGKDAQVNKTHCPQGHAYDEKNTRFYRGARICRMCATNPGRRLPKKKPNRSYRSPKGKNPEADA